MLLEIMYLHQAAEYTYHSHAYYHFNVILWLLLTVLLTILYTSCTVYKWAKLNN